ncbi:ABC transporter, ATPase component, putative Macrolide export ATP-binding protein [Nitrospina gracilis 3/211]|uniref:ABC transporter, ATPase component, putative Macrolide export ATP-binding protein n=1 Tax=Nitrospina gracilis (strain 3/211) TaxID=1266370 RepID=M1Z225_NITG3|nr:ABC transporter ATP-binding protein [Nitrospina gracilis]CCQ91550.1 ABC transporter, ATPase component, putative Macrolide export ATP-binding protein [Nitrospina gracilis 3/211]
MTVALIEIQKLSKTYDLGAEKVFALRDVSFSMEASEFASIMGPSGSGKSTLMNLLGCLDLPSSGTYRLDGIDVQNQSADELAEVRNKKIGFVFQSFNLLPRATALENVELPLLYGRVKEPAKKAMDALQRVGLGHRAKHKPNELSGGEKQRAAIARALVINPRIILADEPTGNLDSKTSADIMKLFTRLNEEGVTIILVTHEQDIAAYSRRIFQMQDGKLVKDSGSAPRVLMKEEAHADI